MKWDIQRQGREWNRSEIEEKYLKLCPEKMELFKGKLFWTNEDRLNVLAMLFGKRRHGCSRYAWRTDSVEASH